MLIFFSVGVCHLTFRRDLSSAPPQTIPILRPFSGTTEIEFSEHSQTTSFGVYPRIIDSICERLCPLLTDCCRPRCDGTMVSWRQRIIPLKSVGMKSLFLFFSCDLLQDWRNIEPLLDARLCVTHGIFIPVMRGAHRISSTNS